MSSHHLERKKAESKSGKMTKAYVCIDLFLLSLKEREPLIGHIKSEAVQCSGWTKSREW